MNITDTSKQIFMSYAADAGNWSGCPMIDGNKQERGNLTQLKKAGLIDTFRDEGCLWLVFTEDGKKFAAENGVTI